MRQLALRRKRRFGLIERLSPPASTEPLTGGTAKGAASTEPGEEHSRLRYESILHWKLCGYAVCTIR